MFKASWLFKRAIYRTHNCKKMEKQEINETLGWFCKHILVYTIAGFDCTGLILQIIHPNDLVTWVMHMPV